MRTILIYEKHTTATRYFSKTNKMNQTECFFEGLLTSYLI